MDGAGVIAVTQYGYGTTAKSYDVIVLDAATGSVLNSINIGLDFGQPVFADDKMFVPSQNRGLIVYSPAAVTAPTASFTVSCTDLTCAFDGSGSTGGVTGYAWDFGDGSAGSGVTVSHTFGSAGSYQVKLTVTGQGGLTGSLTKQVTVPPTARQIAFVAAADANGNQPTETVAVPSSVSFGDALVLIATGATNSPISAPAGWTLVGTNSGNGVMVTSVWSRVATAGDAGSAVTVNFSTTFRRAGVQLLAYSGTSPTSPVLAFASHFDHLTTSTATTPTVSVTSSDMLATDAGAAAAAGTAGGLIASTDQAFSADTTLTLVLTP